MLHITGSLELIDLLVAFDIQKASDSVRSVFSISSLGKYGFGKGFINWTKILLKKSRIMHINGGFAT